MSALDTAKELGREAVLEKIKEAGLMEYGLNRGPLLERLEKAQSGKVHAGLNNADTDKVLLVVLKETPEKVFAGMCVAAFLTGTDSVTLYLPETETELAETLKETADQYKIQIVNDIINVREAENDLLMHIVTAAELTDLLNGSLKPGVYISIDKTTLKKVDENTKISDLVSLDGAKAVKLGYRYYTPKEAGELTAVCASNGVIEVLSETDCMVQKTTEQLNQYRRVSCGKCVFCREGLIQLEYMQRETTAARGKMDYLSLTKEIGEAMLTNTLCTVGQEASKVALDACEKYQEEYEAHIKKNKCPAGVCSSFVRIYIDPQACKGCGDCMDVCPCDCIEGKPKYIHMIDEFECTKCGKCMEACENDAILQTAGKLPKLPDRLTKVGKFRKR